MGLDTGKKKRNQKCIHRGEVEKYVDAALDDRTVCSASNRQKEPFDDVREINDRVISLAPAVAVRTGCQ